MSMISYDRHHGVIYDIDLSAPPDERWIPVAQAYGDKVHALMAHLRVSLDKQTEDLPWWLSLIGSAKKSVAKRIAGTALRILGGDHMAEIRSIADVIDVDLNELATANVMYEVLSTLGRFDMCSSVSYDDPKGRPVMARTLDWDYPDSIGEHTVRLRFHRGKSFYDAVSVAGFVGILSAQRPQAWALALNMAPQTAPLKNLLQRPVGFHLRDCADRSKTYASLVRNIMETQTGASFFAHVIGTKSGERSIITGHGVHYTRRTAEGKEPLVLTNHFIDGDYGDEEAPSSSDSSFERFDALHRRLKRNPRRSVDKAHAIIAREPVTCSNTHQAMVLCPALDHLDLRVQPNSEWAVSTTACPHCDETNITINQGPGEYSCPSCGENFEV